MKNPYLPQAQELDPWGFPRDTHDYGPPYNQGDWRNESIRGKSYADLTEEEKNNPPPPPKEMWYDKPEYVKKLIAKRRKVREELNRQMEEEGIE